MSNPYQPFFDKLDQTVRDLDDQEVELGLDDRLLAADLLKRAGYVLANLLNVQAQVYPMLYLKPEPVQGEVTDTEATVDPVLE